VLRAQGLLRRLDHAALPHLDNLDPAFRDRAYDPGNAHSVPYFWGTTGIAYDRRRVAEPPSSWGALFDPRYRGRILMLDDAREAIGAALKWRGHSQNTRDPALLAAAREDLLRQKALVRTYNSSNFEDVLLAGDVWLAHAWNGQIAKAMEQHPRIAYALPAEGSTLFIDNLAIPADARNVPLAHAFIDFTLEAETAAEICRTMKYSTPNRAARALLPPELLANPAVFPAPAALARLELIEDLGDATVLYDRLWTEVKAR
jgi:spermidine/putrescine-binding protein